jgi:hypothetical protein
MGKLTYHQDGGSRERGVKTLYFKIDIGAAGAPTLRKKLGCKSVTRTGAGVYVLELDEKFQGLLGVRMELEAAVLQDLTHQVTSDDVASAGTVEVTTKTGAAATDPADPSVLIFKVDVKDTSVEF